MPKRPTERLTDKSPTSANAGPARSVDGEMRVRIVFITERALNEAEASALTNIAKATCPGSR